MQIIVDNVFNRDKVGIVNDESMKPKVAIGTRVEEDVYKRLEVVADREMNSVAGIMRKCIVRHLPQLEREVLGEAFVGPVAPDDEPELAEAR